MSLNQPRLLGLFAHPDDEVLGMGGLIAQYTAAGVHVEWVVTTRGEAGEISDPALATPETLGQVREQEMRCAARTLGMANVTFLDYRDSGMAGAPDNLHPDAYLNSNPDEVVTKLVEIIRRVRPHVALTFEPYGGYGHPDHITIHKHTHLALPAAADPHYRPDLGAPWHTPRLFYPFLRMSSFMILKERMVAHNLPADFFDGLEQNRSKAGPITTIRPPSTSMAQQTPSGQPSTVIAPNLAGTAFSANCRRPKSLKCSAWSISPWPILNRRMGCAWTACLPVWNCKGSPRRDWSNF